MSRKPPPTTRPVTGRSREDRLKSALKANLARRKAQVRGRGETDAGQGTPGDTAMPADTDTETGTETDKE